MSENENKRRLMSIGNRVKLRREKMGLTQEQFADKYGYARTTLAKLEAGLRDFKSTEIIALAEQLKVSCDYLLGRSRAAAPDDFIQEVVSRYGLTEQALQLLECLNSSLDIDIAEKERISTKQIEFEDRLRDIMNGNAIPKRFPVALEKEEWEILLLIWQEETNRQALSMLNDLLTASTGREWETYGCLILTTIYNYCRREFSDVQQVHRGVTGSAYYTLTSEQQRSIELLRLNDIIAELRNKLINDDKK